MFTHLQLFAAPTNQLGEVAVPQRLLDPPRVLDDVCHGVADDAVAADADDAGPVLLGDVLEAADRLHPHSAGNGSIDGCRVASPLKFDHRTAQVMSLSYCLDQCFSTEAGGTPRGRFDISDGYELRIQNLHSFLMPFNLIFSPL